MKRNRAPEQLRGRPQIIDPMAVVGMVVGDDNAVEPGSPRRQ